MRQKSNGETKSADWMSLPIEKNPGLPEPELACQAIGFMERMNEEMCWVGQSGRDRQIVTDTVLAFVEYLKENFYHVGRN